MNQRKHSVSMLSNRLPRSVGNASLSLIAMVFSGALLLAWSASSVWQVVGLMSAEADNQPVSEVRTFREEPLDRQPVNIASLAAIPLFGEEIKKEDVAVPEVEEKKEEPLVETKLNLILKGLFTADDDSAGRAIIANGRNEKLYQVGDSIEGLSSVSLSGVFSGSVRLNNRGKPEVLYLYPDGEQRSLPASQDSAASPPSSQDQLERVIQHSPPATSTDPSIPKLSEVIRVVHEKDKVSGEMLGFRVLPGRKREVFEKSGLLINDVITAIDGEALNDARSANVIYRSKRNASQLSLMVSRKGSDVLVDIDFSALP